MGLAIGGVFAGPTMALFICGIFLPIANWKGSVIGFIFGSGDLVYKDDLSYIKLRSLILLYLKMETHVLG